jgi:hypothetical protein
MSKKISDKAIAKVPAFADRISLFSSKLQISRYAAGTITDYCHALYKAVLQVGKLPEEFTQQDLDDYLKSMLCRKPLPAEAQFKHFIYGLKCYLNTLGHKAPTGLVLPKIRREEKLPRVMSMEYGEDIQTVKDRLGHRSIQTTMIYLHVARIEKHNCIPLIDMLFKDAAKA